MAVNLDSFAGATDDDKLTAAISYTQAQTYKQGITFGPRDHQLTIPRGIVSGLKLLGGPEVSNQARGANSTPQRIRLNIAGGGPWLRMPASGSVFDVEISRLSFYSSSSTTDFMGGGSSVLWTSFIRDCGWVNFRHVLGSPTSKLLLTACQFGGGWWNINNSRGRAITLGGSDNSLWEGTNFLLDSPTNLSGTTDAHLVFDYMSKTTVGSCYITAEGGPAAMIINGSNNSSGLVFVGGFRAEGRNANSPSFGSVIRINGGINTFDSSWFAYAATNFSGTPRTNEQGAISVFGGNTIIDKPLYARATGVAETVPFIYASGANTKVAVRLARGAGSAWYGKPAVKAVNGAQIDADSSVTFV